MADRYHRGAAGAPAGQDYPDLAGDEVVCGDGLKGGHEKCAGHSVENTEGGAGGSAESYRVVGRCSWCPGSAPMSQQGVAVNQCFTINLIVD